MSQESLEKHHQAISLLDKSMNDLALMRDAADILGLTNMDMSLASCISDLQLANEVMQSAYSDLLDEACGSAVAVNTALTAAILKKD
jgi:hypothetical protein